MRIVKTKEHLDRLREAEVFSPDLQDHLEEYFLQLHRALGDGRPLDDFRLNWLEGFVGVLERGDNVRDLSVLGLNPGEEGLLGSRPEFVEANYDATPAFYRISVLLDNECMMTFFSEIGVHDDEVEEWLAERAEVDRAYDHPADEEIPF